MVLMMAGPSMNRVNFNRHRVNYIFIEKVFMFLMIAGPLLNRVKDIYSTSY